MRRVSPPTTGHRQDFMKLVRIYDAPTWTESDDSVWVQHISDADFVSQSVGWVIGSGQVSHTNDGGRSWINQFDQPPSNGLFLPRRVFAVNQFTVWLLTLSDQFSPNCFFTTNGGKKWLVKEVPSLREPKDIFFIDDRCGWIISDDGQTPAVHSWIHATVDGGSTWQSHDLAIYFTPAKVSFIDKDSGILLQVACDRLRNTTISNILITEDGGSSWRVLKSFPQLVIDIHITRDHHLFVVGESGFISKCKLGETRWKHWRPTTDGSLNVIASSGPSVFVGGDFGVLLISQDGGEHWSRYHSPFDLDHIVNICLPVRDQAILATTTAVFSLTL